MQVCEDVADYNDDLRKVGEVKDRQAFARLFAHFGPRVKAYMMRSTPDPAYCEELVQETMMQIWRKAHMFDSNKAQASTWIFTIARNLRIDRIRKETHPNFDPDDPAFEPSMVDDGEMTVTRNQDRSRVARALSELPEDQVTVVKMSFYEDKSHAEIAETLDLPLGTVKSRMRLAFKKMKSALEDA